LKDIRLVQLEKWLSLYPEIKNFELTPASSDASFRRYFRVTNKTNSNNEHGFTEHTSYIAMDAPPEKEDSAAFVDIANMLFIAGINVPKIIQKNFDKGFFLISDLGNEQYLPALNESSFSELYQSAIESLVNLQLIAGTRLQNIPDYDKKLLMTEMELFRDWYLIRHLGRNLSSDEDELLLKVFTFLADNALAQKQLLVHRDYHSRNLMTNDKNPNAPGILDFQDAVIGPFTYDLVSLLRDCYVSWPEQQVKNLAIFYKDLAEKNKIIADISESEFLRYFDLMGLQRHLKAIGIFSRLNYRDNKSSYLDDIPRTLNYVVTISSKYSELSDFNSFLKLL